MLGKFSTGMSVRIPAKFQDSSKNPVAVDNVIVGIEYYSKDENKIMNLLLDTPMNKIADGDYVYEYQIPTTLDPGNYIVRIKAKQPGSKSNVLEATDFFEISEISKIDPTSIIQTINNQPNYDASDPRLPDAEALSRIKHPDQLNQSNPSQRTVEDVIFDAYGQPLHGALVDVYDKRSYIPRSNENIKVATAVSNENGKWSLRINAGDYVFVFKGPRVRGVVEFRKIQ